MRTTYGLGVLSAATLSLVWACSSSSPANSLGGGDGGGPDTSVDEGGGDDGGAEGGEDGGPGVDSGKDGSMGNDGGGNTNDASPGDAAPTDAGPLAAQCPTGHTWVAGSLLVSDSMVRFSGVAPTGLTAAWMRTSGDVIAADRGNASSSFTTLAVLLPAPPTGDRAALDATGNLVLAIDATGLYPQFWQRTDRQSPWDLSMASTTPFDAIVQAVNQMGQQWSEPAFGASGDRLFYLVGELSSSKAGAAPLLYESQWDAQTSSWAAGVPLTNPELASADTTHRRRPTGASADDLTLFYYDEVNGVEGAAWRTDPSQPFSHFETIPAAPEAAPNLDCSALYFVGGGPLVPDGGTGGGGDGGMVIGPPGSDAGMTVGDAGTPWNGSGTGIYVAQ